MDVIAPAVNKWTLSALAGLMYHVSNRYELLGDASDPRIEPLQSVVVGLLVLIACFFTEWSLRKRGFLPNLVLTPESMVPSSGVYGGAAETMVLPSSWND